MSINSHNNFFKFYLFDSLKKFINLTHSKFEVSWPLSLDELYSRTPHNQLHRDQAQVGNQILRIKDFV